MENIQWYPGHMAKTRRMLEENISLIDIVVEIIDARIPFSGKNYDFDDIFAKKPRIVLLNKYDLADNLKTEKWIKWYNQKGIKVIPVSCIAGTGINKIPEVAKTLVHDKILRDSQRGMKRNIKLMIVGIPNVGKSSLINKLVGKAATKTGDRPGVTRTKQWVRIKDGLELLDTPGILQPKYEDQNIAMKLAYTGAIKDEIMETELIAYSLLEFLRDTYPELLKSRYKLDDISNLKGYEILDLIGRKRGCLISGGEIDEKRASDIVLDDFRAMKIGKITLESPEDYDDITL